jgi:hypothetical protein
METKVYFSLNGNMKKFNFEQFSYIWLKDIYEEIYEQYVYIYKEDSDYPYYFETPNQNNIVENYSFSFETEEQAINNLCKYHFPKFSMFGPIVEEGKHEYISGDSFYTYDKTLYPKTIIVDIKYINVISHKYSRDLDKDKEYTSLPPIKLKYCINDDYLYTIIDGFHRIKYSKEKKFKKIPAIIE